MTYKEPEIRKLLSWPHSVNIVGLASILVYLHQEYEQRVIHRDIKTGNVLLDGNFNPRLGCFGLAKFADHDKHPSSTLIVETMEYLALDYLQCNCVSLVLYGVLLSDKIEFSTHVAIELVHVLFSSVHKVFGDKVVLLMHLEFYSLRRQDLNLKCVLEYHEEAMKFISKLIVLALQALAAEQLLLLLTSIRDWKACFSSLWH